MTELKFTPPALVQRLLLPGNGQPFSDGELGFKPEFLDRFNREIGMFDYMGRSEFEHGAVPRAIMLTSKRHQTYPFAARKIQVDCTPDKFDKSKYDLPENKSATVYIIAPEMFMEQVLQFIQSEAASESRDLCERSMFHEAVFSEEIQNKRGSASNVRGWFDLQNSFFFFTDEKMYKEMKKFWGLQDPPTPREASPEPHA